MFDPLAPLSTQIAVSGTRLEMVAWVRIHRQTGKN